ncbi:MAG: phosphoglycerate kinase [Promethearchaeota archaeon]
MDRFLSQLDEAYESGYEFVKSGPILFKRADINSVMPNAGTIVNDRRIRESLDTSIELRQLGAFAIAEAAHQSRVGKSDFYPTLEHSKVMNRLLKDKYPDTYDDWEFIFDESCWGLSQLDLLIKGRNVLSNNIRFAPWELQVPSKLHEIPPIQLIEKLKKAGHKIGYVQDAFASAHRGGKGKDTSMLALPAFLKENQIPVFPSKHFVNEMRKYANIHELIIKGKRVVIALFGGKIKDYIDVLSLYQRRDNTEFLAGSLLSLIFLKSQNPRLSFGVNEDLFFKDIGQDELKHFKAHYIPERVHLAQDLLLSRNNQIITQSINSNTNVHDDVQGIGPLTARTFGEIVKGAQLLIVNGCPCNINRFDEFGTPFTDFLRQIRKQNANLTIYECGGDAITAIKFTEVRTDVSSTAGKLGLLAPMIETTEDLERFAPSVIPLISID